jgi:AcrR family transcriptional regulator
MARQRSSTEVRQKQIIRAAAKLIIRYGSEHVTIKKIAQEISISEAAIYRHFKSKRDILSLLVDDIENTLMAEIQLTPLDSRYDLEAIEKLFTEHMSQIVHRRGISFQVIAEIISFGDQKLNKKVHNVVEKYTHRISDILSEGVNTGAIRDDIDLDTISVLFFGMTQGLVNLWTLSHYEFDLKQRYAALWNVFRELVRNQ